MKIPIHKATDICFLGDTPVVITNRHYNVEESKHKYRCKPLSIYYKSSSTFSTYGIQSSGLVFNRNNTTALKGRDLITAKPIFTVYRMTDTKADKPELNFTVELKRTKFKTGAF